jgi:succinate dehydrogenase/fumarate reductase flavoprotein subunit
MLRKCQGVFVAGEMIDWEAPTGGYLLQGCFSTGTRAGRSAATFRRGTATHPSRVLSSRMSDDEKDEGERHKKVTAATADAPMEEFISPTNQPSVPETPGAPERRTEQQGGSPDTLNDRD